MLLLLILKYVADFIQKLLDDLALQQAQLEQEIEKVHLERDVNRARLLTFIFNGEHNVSQSSFEFDHMSRDAMASRRQVLKKFFFEIYIRVVHNRGVGEFQPFHPVNMFQINFKKPVQSFSRVLRKESSKLVLISILITWSSSTLRYYFFSRLLSVLRIFNSCESFLYVYNYVQKNL